MAYYDLYHNAPGWGTSGYHFATPPVPSYQPQPSWGGLDYYRAHGGFNDPYVSPIPLVCIQQLRKYSPICIVNLSSMYDYAYNRLRDYPGTGVGLEEARHWHRRAYGGMVCSAFSLLGNLNLNT